MSALPFLAERLLERPLLATPAHAATVLGVLADRLDVSRIALGADLLDPAEVRARAAGQVRVARGYAVDGGVAIIPIVGSLISRGSAIAPRSGLTSYTGVGEALDAALADPEVRGIALDVDSPGGEVAGCFDLARRIRAASLVKPVWAILDEEANSGAYALVSGAGRILIPRTGAAGSVGVITLHRDRSEQVAREGVRVTIIKAGARKADGNPFEPLPDDVRGRIQAAVDDIHGQFAALVAEHRGLPLAAVYGTEADVLLAPAAVELGFVDAIMPARDALAEFRQHLALARTAPAVPLAGDVLPVPELDDGEEVAVSTTATTYPARPAAGTVDALRREIAGRFAAVLGLPDAQGPLAPLAQHLVGTTELSAEEIGGVLAVAKACKGGGGHTDFHAAMSRFANPTVGPDREEDGGEVDALLARARAREGRG